jgi:hypothetical protein
LSYQVDFSIRLWLILVFDTLIIVIICALTIISNIYLTLVLIFLFSSHLPCLLFGPVLSHPNRGLAYQLWYNMVYFGVNEHLQKPISLIVVKLNIDIVSILTSVCFVNLRAWHIKFKCLANNLTSYRQIIYFIWQLLSADVFSKHDLVQYSQGPSPNLFQTAPSAITFLTYTLCYHMYLVYEMTWWTSWNSCEKNSEHFPSHSPRRQRGVIWNIPLIDSFHICHQKKIKMV